VTVIAPALGNAISTPAARAFRSLPDHGGGGEGEYESVRRARLDRCMTAGGKTSGGFFLPLSPCPAHAGARHAAAVRPSASMTAVLNQPLAWMMPVRCAASRTESLKF